MDMFKKIFKSGRVIVLLLFLVFSIVAIHPIPWNDGVAIRAIAKDSPAYSAGIVAPKATATPMSRERILSLDQTVIHDIEDYYSALEKLRPNVSVQVKTDRRAYRVMPQYRVEVVELDEMVLENRTREVFDEKTNATVNETYSVEVAKTSSIVHSEEPVDLGISVYDAPKTNLRKGLELQGGTRVLMQPREEVSDEVLSTLIASLEQRINVFGISDVSIKPATDLSGSQFVLVEIAGITEEEIKNLLASQGKFEAKVGNVSVFQGGSDITYVCRSADCSGIDPRRGCSQVDVNQWGCSFYFTISLSPEAARRQAAATRDLPVLSDTNSGEGYLSEKLYLFLDDSLVDTLNIGASLKGQASTDIQISGSGMGSTQADAMNNALANMKNLQTILITGSLPVKLDIVKVDAVSPTLGEEFVSSTLLMALLATLAVILVIFLKYREWKITIPIAITMVAEIVILLGIAALIGWNLDLAAIAGIIVAVGTGVDDQIVITDETLRAGRRENLGWKERFKRAMFIIMGAYLVAVVSMLPLLFAGAGLLKGFALTTILGVSVGVFLTRPAYAAIVEILLNKD
jgi:preprotein translocase subunit SecD